MSCPELLNRLHDFWRDFNTIDRWKFPELSPASLQKWLDFNLGQVDYAQFARAEWMWRAKAQVAPRKEYVCLHTPGFRRIAFFFCSQVSASSSRLLGILRCLSQLLMTQFAAPAGGASTRLVSFASFEVAGR